MKTKKNIFAIIGSAGANSTNLNLVKHIASVMASDFNWTIYNDLKLLPHFDPELSIHNSPEPIVAFRASIESADAVLICTPEYIFSIPSGLKNAIEWCISSTVFSNKPCGLITASAQGLKGHEELQLIMNTAMANFNSDTTLLIQGVKGKFDENGQIKDNETQKQLQQFVQAFRDLLEVG